ncbi:uncharacterized protein LOC111258328 [Setaria italica]|uniref:uncharacterized protein LOC111258328 n=1 Tax=Setaria italica TaxID=4555 RepID=UPI000BE5C046|nr:uncharacterized protein LOC111258328 [Setaria italica]
MVLKDNMGTSTYASAEEVEKLRALVDNFIHKQEDQNKTLESSLDKILSSLSMLTTEGDPSCTEDKGSNYKGKNASPSPQMVASKSVHMGNNFMTSQQHFYTPPPEGTTHMRQFDNIVWPTMGQKGVADPVDADCPWTEKQLQEFYNQANIPFDAEQDQNHYETFPTQQEAPHQCQFGQIPISANTYSQQQHSTSHSPFVNQLHMQQKLIAKGPKLAFPEFDGTDPDGWIRKSEKYFELVGIPNEHRVQIAVMMLSDRFNEESSYEVIARFHGLKHTTSVEDYVAKFEELMALAYKSQFNTTYNVTSQLHRPMQSGMLGGWNKLILQLGNSNLSEATFNHQGFGPRILKRKKAFKTILLDLRLLENVSSAKNPGYLAMQKFVKNLPISEIDKVKVAAANDVQGFDVVLGADWIYAHSPVGLDLKRREFSITGDGKEITTFTDESDFHGCQLISNRKLCNLVKKKAVGAVLVLNNTQEERSKHSVSIPAKIQEVLEEFKDVFTEPKELPPPRGVDHSIPLIDEAKTINQRPYRLPHHQKNAMEELIQHLMEAHMIRPSVSPYSSPVILVKKKDSTWGLCVDFRQLNSNTVKNKYPIPIIEDLLDELFGAQVFSKIDLRSGYHHIRMKESDIHKTAFTTHVGHFEYLVMPFGLTNAPTTFQTLMNNVLADFLRKFASVFFDDILNYSTSMQDHVDHLRAVLAVLRENKLHAKFSKCTFAQSEVEYLGHVISKAGVATDPSKIIIIQKWPTPKTTTELRAFLGLTGYYRRFIQGYGIICRPLFDALKKNAFEWTSKQDQAFAQLKNIMSNPPVLALPDFSQPFILEADASGTGIGAVLMQNGRPLSFLSKTLGPKAAALSIYEKEAMAILEALKKWKHYLASTSVIIRNDQQSLKYIHEQRLLAGIQHKLLVKLLGNNYKIEYKKGKENRAADALSRVDFNPSTNAISMVIPAWVEQVIAIRMILFART